MRGRGRRLGSPKSLAPDAAAAVPLLLLVPMVAEFRLVLAMVGWPPLAGKHSTRHRIRPCGAISSSAFLLLLLHCSPFSGS